MIRTLIEVTAENVREYEDNLEKALDQLGYAKKETPDQERFKRDLASALHERELTAWQIVEEYRAKHPPVYYTGPA